MATELDLDEFLDHSAGGKGGGGSFLENWKENGSIVVWLHPRAQMYAMWFHNWFRLDTGDAANPLSEYKMQRFNCLEDEKVLKKQRFRNGDGSRELPPVICPHCLMIEWVRNEIEESRLSWTKPVFKFGDDRVILAGGLTGMFGDRNLSDAQKRELKRAGVRIDEAYLQDGKAGLNYLLRPISNADPKDGAKITYVKQSLGDKLKKAIRDRRDEYVAAGLDEKEADIRKNPVAFQWKFDEKADFSNKYDVIRLEKVKMSPEVEAAMEQEPPDVSQLIAASNLDQHYASLEEHALIPMPFDEFFAPIEKKNGRKVSGQVADDLDDEAEDDLPASYGGKGKPSAAPAASAKAKPAATKKEPEVELFPCDKCGEVCLKDEDLECPKCGAEYFVDDDGFTKLKPDPEPEPPRRRRGKST